MELNNINITKQGLWISLSDFIENGSSSFNNFQKTVFSSYNSGTFTVANGIYTITSPVSTSSWGSGVYITNGKILVPYNCIYRVKIEVNVPTAHRIQVDINNSVPSGVTIQGGNDNDLGSARTTTSWNIPANTWTTIEWGSKNAHASNTTGVDISVYDGIGLITSADSAAVVWQIRNPRIYIAYNEKDKAGVDKTGFVYSNYFYEL